MITETKDNWISVFQPAVIPNRNKNLKIGASFPAARSAPPTPKPAEAERAWHFPGCRLTSIFLIEGVHAGEIDGQRLERRRQAHLALGALDAHPWSRGRGVIPLPAHGDPESSSSAQANGFFFFKDLGFPFLLGWLILKETKQTKKVYLQKKKNL